MIPMIPLSDCASKTEDYRKQEDTHYNNNTYFEVPKVIHTKEKA
jgi:hypothetical protein